MLFDLRGGRRRTVQAVYILLAVLMGGGLILFGIGGSVSGGLIDAITNNNGNASTGLGTYRKRVDQAQRQANARPQDAAAWAQLARARFQLASASDYYDPNSGVWNAKGKQILAQASVPVLGGDDEERLHERIKEVEHKMLPEVCSALLSRRSIVRSPA